MTSMSKFPAPPEITEELLRWLEAMYPDRAPDPGMSDRIVWMNAGQAHLIRAIRIEQARQQSEKKGPTADVREPTRRPRQLVRGQQSTGGSGSPRSPRSPDERSLG